MQRWQLTTGLAAATVLAALIVPSIRGALSSDPVPVPEPLVPVPVPVPVETTASGPLKLDAMLDQEALLIGSGEHRYLVVDVSADPVEGDLRLPVNVAVVVDTSGSMQGQGKMDNARMAARELVGLLGPQDTFSLVGFDDRGKVLVESAPVADRGRIDRIIASMGPGGGTNLHDGLRMGLDQLSKPSLEGVKRVVLLSDGMANIGVTDEPSLARLAGSKVEQGITVSGLGLGLEYNEDLLAAMSDAGGGRYHFVDRPGQLSTLFADELHQMTAIVGRQATIDVKLPAGVHLEEVYGWSSEVTKDGYRVFLGDVHGGETRKVVARVRVDDQRPAGEIAIAEVGLQYTDPESSAAASASDRVVATLTPQAEVAQASLNVEASNKAARAVSAQAMDEAVRAYEKGDKHAQQQNIEIAAGVLRSTSARTGDAALAAEAAEYDDLGDTLGSIDNESDDGIYQVKKLKETSRARSR